MRTLLKWSFLLIVLLTILSVVLLSASIYTFNRLTDETLIAELRFDATGDRQYIAHLRTGDGCTERVLPVLGDQWRVDAQFLKWKYWALLFGLDSQYRLDRLEGRYRSTAEQNSEPNIAHDLAGGTTLDVVNVASALGTLNFLLDATYGSSTYEDIDTASVYNVYRTQTGIIARTEPRPAAVPGEALPVEVNRACSIQAPLWQRVTTWSDQRVVSLLDWWP